PTAQCYPLQTAATGCISGSPNYQNSTGARAVQAPKWKFASGTEYSPASTDTSRGVAQLNWQYQSSLYFVAEDPQTFQKAYSIVNIASCSRAEDRRWESTGFINNSFDKQYYGSSVNTASNFGTVSATQAVSPRDYRRYGGVRVKAGLIVAASGCAVPAMAQEAPAVSPLNTVQNGPSLVSADMRQGTDLSGRSEER
ncbi:hypothetical protein OY671_008905, partial [Metschnikowia pulcherrima]